MRIDILTQNDLPYTFENYAALRLKKELEKVGVKCRHISDLGPYLYEVRGDQPDWTIAFEDLLGWKTPLCDILGIKHFHWERNSLQGLDHLMRSPNCEIGFHQKVDGIHHLPLPIEKVPHEKKIFDAILFLDLDESTRAFVESFDSRIDIFGNHKGKNWLVRLKNREHVYLHMPLPFTEQLRALSMSRFVIMKEDDPLSPFALAADCLPVMQLVSETKRLDVLTKKVLTAHSWELKTRGLLQCLSR